MTWLPISFTPPQFLDSNGDPYTGAVLKFYQDGTTTNINMATDSTGATTLSDVALDSDGYPSNGGSVFVPHLDQAYKVALYPTQAAADADTGADWTIDNLSPADLTDTDTDELAKVSSNDTTAGYLNGKLTAGSGITLTEGSDGGNETFSIAQTNSLTLGAEQATTSGTEIDFTGIPSGTKKIIILFDGVSTDGTSYKQIQLGDSGGFETTGYAGVGYSLDVTPTAGGQVAGTGAPINSVSASDTLRGEITCYLQDSSNFEWVISGMLSHSTTLFFTSVTKALSSELTQVRITTFNGTDAFDAGAINIQYE